MEQPSVGAVFHYFLAQRPGEVEEALREFTGASYLPQQSEFTEEQLQSFFGSWFLFDYRLPSSGQAPLTIYLKEQGNELTAQEQAYYQALLTTNRFDIFEVLRVDRGQGLRLRQLRTGTEYEITERQGTYDAVPEQIFLCRIWHAGEMWQLAPDIVTYPPAAAPLWREQANKMEQPPSPRQVWQMATKQLIQSTAVGLEALDKFLRDHEADPALTPQDILEWLKDDQDLRRTLQRVVQHVKPKSQAAFEELMQILSKTWNTLSIKERDGGAAIPNWEPGPVEEALLEELRAAALAAIDPESFASLADVNQALADFQSRWVDTPLLEYRDKTPRQLVTEEREASNHHEKDWTVQLQLQEFGDAQQERANALLKAGNEAHRRGDLIEAEQYYRQLIAEYDDPYQAWGNLGLVLASQGKKQAAIDALKQALVIEPDYQLARLNLSSIQNLSIEELKRQRMVVGASVLRIGIYEKLVDQLASHVASAEVQHTPALQDMLALITYLRDQGPLQLTPARQEFRLADIRAINQRLRKPTPEQETFTGPPGTTTWRRRSQAEFETVNLLYCLLLAMKLAQRRAGRFHLTRAGKKFLSLSPFEQYLRLLWGYFAELNWASLSNHVHTITAGFIGQSQEAIQEVVPERLGMLLHQAKNEAWTPLAKMYPAATDTDKELPLVLLMFPEEKMLWQKLVWFGLAQLQYAEGDNDVPTFSRIANIQLTALGSKVVPELATKAIEEAPLQAGRNDPCPCGSGKKFKKCHGRRY